MLKCKSFLHKCVSTIRDECNGVGDGNRHVPQEGGNRIRVEDMVSACGDTGWKRVEHSTCSTSTDSDS